MQILLVDVPYLCYRAWHSAKKESTPYMLLSVIEQETRTAKERFGTDRIVFAFDHPINHRRKIQPDYKSSRNIKRTEDEQQEHREFCEQIDIVKDICLPNLGYSNVFCVEGFEADDIIAKICQDAGLGETVIHTGTSLRDQCIIYSADKDLWQCVGPNVIWCSPHTGQVVSHRSFAEEWGLNPWEWANVKALAGCTSDDVSGIDGIGEITAAKFLRGELKRGKKYQAIEENLMPTLNRNLPLVKLPFEGCPTFEVRVDDLTKAKRESVLESLGVEVKRERRSKRKGFVW